MCLVGRSGRRGRGPRRGRAVVMGSNLSVSGTLLSRALGGAYVVAVFCNIIYVTIGFVD
jgi:hypothetical protein